MASLFKYHIGQSSTTLEHGVVDGCDVASEGHLLQGREVVERLLVILICARLDVASKVDFLTGLGRERGFGGFTETFTVDGDSLTLGKGNLLQGATCKLL